VEFFCPWPVGGVFDEELSDFREVLGFCAENSDPFWKVECGEFLFELGLEKDAGERFWETFEFLDEVFSLRVAEGGFDVPCIVSEFEEGGGLFLSGCKNGQKSAFLSFGTDSPAEIEVQDIFFFFGIFREFLFPCGEEFIDHDGLFS
jgi:hypothetical protein